MFQINNYFRSRLGQNLYRILIREVIGTFDRIEGMGEPVVIVHILSEAAIPPCAATECDRIGCTLEINPTLRFG